MEGSSLSDLDSEDELQIDETPPPRRKHKASSKKKKLSSKYLILEDGSCARTLEAHGF